MNNEIDMLIRHRVKVSNRDAPLHAADRSDVMNHIHGVGYGDKVTMGEVLRAASPDRPELTKRLVALAAATYRAMNGAAYQTPDTTPTPAPPSAASRSARSLGGVEYGPAVSGFPARWETGGFDLRRPTSR